MSASRLNASLTLHIVALVVTVLVLPLQVMATTPSDGRPAIQGVDDPMTIVDVYLDTHALEMGLGVDDLAELVVTDTYVSAHTGVSHVYLEQRFEGIEIAHAMINFNILPDGTIVRIGDRLQRDLAARVRPAADPLTAIEAINAAAADLGLPTPFGLIELTPKRVGDETRRFSDGGISTDEIAVRVVYQPTGSGGIREAWEIEIDTLDGNHSWVATVDADTGELLAADDLVTWDSYRVYPRPVESPIHTTPAPPADARVLVTDPAIPSVSPHGWHDTNNMPGAEETLLRGNNVFVYEDIAGANTVPATGDVIDCGPLLSCEFPLDLAAEPHTRIEAAATNAFYWTNLAHDVLYTYGFDEPAGNMQLHNYGRGGVEGDGVFVEIQDGMRHCSARFHNRADGVNQVLEVGICGQATPARDGALDNLIVVHEYAHGLSSRLTGGPATPTCLSAAELVGGEGWSDLVGLAFTMKTGDQAADSRSVGSYMFPTGHPLLRPGPYSTDWSVNAATYDLLPGLDNPHKRGWLWASILWEALWRLVDIHGFDPEIADPWTSGGNNLAMQLVTDGLKLQPCNPGFVDARDAILSADAVLTAEQNSCTLWSAFARRGLGEGANQGDPNDITDGTASFDLPSECIGLELITPAEPICAGDDADFGLRATPIFASAPVDLAVTTRPTGTTASFSVNPLAPPLPRESMLTISNTGGLAAGTHQIEVDGDDGALWNRLVLDFDVFDSPPTVTMLLAPVDLAGNVALRPELGWTTTEHTTSYELEIATDNIFTNVVYTAGVSGINRHRPTTNLEPGTFYYWRVSSSNPCDTVTSPVFGFTTADEVVMVSPENQPFGAFGTAVAMDGDTVVVGAPNTEGFFGDPNAGRTYVFARNKVAADRWGLVTTLFFLPGEDGDLFGSSVAISGDAIVVGAPGAENIAGRVVVFERNQGGPDSWNQTAVLAIQDSLLAGNAVDIDGHQIVVGAPASNVAGTSAGIAAVFKRNDVGGWDLEEEILAQDASPAEDLFGWSVAISHDRIAVGAPFDEDNSLDSGSVSIFGRNRGGVENWGLIAEVFDDPDADPAGDGFGASVALDNDTLVVGSPYDEGPFGTESGTVSIFERNTGGADAWGRIHEVWAADRIAGDRLGESVALRNQTIVAGAPGHDAIGSDTGAAYVFERNHDPANPDVPLADNWGQIAKLISSNISEGDEYGAGVAVDHDRVVVGSPVSDWGNENDIGVVYLVSRGVDSWVETAQTVEPNGPWIGEAVAIAGDTVVVGLPDRLADGGGEEWVPVFAQNQGGGEVWGKIAELNYQFILGEYPEYYGSSIDISGDTAIVGDPEFCSESPLPEGGVPCWASGAGFVFERNHGGVDSWGEVRRLLPTDEPEYSWFGHSVAIEGDRAVVGAPETTVNGEDYAGKAYLFERNQGGADNWGLAKVFDAGTLIQYDALFGTSVAISGDRVAVSVPEEEGTGYVGAIYIFERNHGGPDAWGLVTRVTRPSGSLGYEFGIDLDIDIDTLVVGGEADVAYVFERNQGGADNWGLVREIAPAVPGQDFGVSVAIDGDMILVGRRYPTEGPDGTPLGGPVEVRERNQGGADNWGFVGSLEPDFGFMTYTSFGMFPGSISLDGRTAVVGGTGFEGPQPLSVSFVFQLDGQWPDAPPTTLIFADGFESGDSSMWSSTLP